MWNDTETKEPPASGFVTAHAETFFDAVLVVSFGGPEGIDDVMPFLENVTRGRRVPRERVDEVARHYARFNGVSPINAQNRALIDALRDELDEHGIGLPIYFGNRNWHPFLGDTLRQMADDGVERALAFFTSAYSSYSGCRQYRENVYEAQQAVGSEACEVLKMRAFYNHPGFVCPNAEHASAALAEIPVDRRSATHLAFVAHSIPQTMAEHCRYEAQLAETARLVAERVRVEDFAVVYQSKSGAPGVPWLDPDICDHLRAIADRAVTDVVISPIGFISDHLEVKFDLDIEAREVAEKMRLNVLRASTVGTHPKFVAMIRELVEERLDPGLARRSLGDHGPSHDVCPSTCCLSGTGHASPWASVQDT